MKFRSVFFTVIFFLILLLFTEVLLRLVLVFYGYPFFRPSDYLYKGIYQGLDKVAEKNIQRGDDVKDVLILGGSVVSTAWSRLESRLDTILSKKLGNGQKFAFYNQARAGYTSLDNRIQYELLDKQRFDLVIYYEAINENRANNVPPKDFLPDYSHIKWYSDIYLLRAHPEINFTVIPFLVAKVIKAARDIGSHKVYISQETVDPKFIKYGADIKTAKPFRKNLGEIINMANHRGDNLLLMSYASYFPQNVVLTGQESDMKHFAGCNFASPVVIWGNPENVKKGIKTHNEVITELARENHLNFMDMANTMPKDSSLFCDVCHVSEAGAQRYANELSDFIVKNKLLR